MSYSSRALEETGDQITVFCGESIGSEQLVYCDFNIFMNLD